MKRILVCGGRDYKDHRRVFEILDKALKAFGEVHIIEGGADGADTCARMWAESRGITYSEYPADWKKLGKRAGYVWNVQMLNEGKPDLVVAFPGGPGTEMMMKLAKAAMKPVREIR